MELNDSIRLRQLFFRRLAFRFLPEMRLLLRGGKLWKRAGWREVVGHCLVQAAAAEALGELLGLPHRDGFKLARAAAVHDWDKRLEVRATDFSSEDREFAKDLLDKVDPDVDLVKATHPIFLIKALVECRASWLEKLAFYLDDLCQGSDIVPWQVRVAEVEKRRGSLLLDSASASLLKGGFWENEKRLCADVESEIAIALLDRGVRVSNSLAMVTLIREKINRAAMAGSSKELAFGER